MSMAIARYAFKLGMYWSIIASGALAAHLATISGRTFPSLTGKSRKRGGLPGFGDHAAANARLVDGPNPRPRPASSASSRVRMVSDAAMASGRGLICAFRQHALRI